MELVQGERDSVVTAQMSFKRGQELYICPPIKFLAPHDGESALSRNSGHVLGALIELTQLCVSLAMPAMLAF